MTTVAEMQALAAVPSIAQHLGRINVNLDRVATALERLVSVLEKEDEPTRPSKVQTHYLVRSGPAKAGVMRCAHCGKSEAELGPDATNEVCPSAPY